MSSSTPPSWSLSFSSSPSLSSDNHRRLHHDHRINYGINSPRFQLRCAMRSVAAPTKKKLWKQGEYPGDVSGNSSFDRNKKRTPIKNIKKKLDRKNNLNPWVNTVTQALSGSIDAKQWLRALEIFKMLKEQPFYQPKEGTYMKLIVLVGRCGQPQHARNLFNSMIEEGLEPTAQIYTALLAAYCRSNLIDEAFKVLEQMKKLPLCQPDVYTFSILIKACVDALRFDLVESLYQEMSERGITPNTVTQNTVLAGYGKAGKFDLMEKVLLGMLDSTSSKPDVWTMNTILSLFGNMGHVETMERWYEKFRNFGIEPETRTFNILIGAYGKKKMYDKMSTVMEYMRKLSFPWTTSTYNNVIEAFSDVGDAKNMEYTFDQMRGEGMRADTKTFCCLIRGYANAGLFHKVISMVELAGKLDIPENTSFHNAVLYACAKADDLMEMERVYMRMKDQQQCRADATTFAIMVEAYKKEGMNDKVFDLEQEQEMMLRVT
ncbi:hypothetical protein L1987_06982 [Smallanthus sonchifolius]|uniref:Uncharacterized protein n=1 Tax=Smallanthus sonchifolius TaxID=185202 RepID=A0ACB9JZR3_9ASTR|nr:hypothetical protein L1987_06982 [Smallanthus sonchifolius]